MAGGGDRAVEEGDRAGVAGAQGVADDAVERGEAGAGADEQERLVGLAGGVEAVALGAADAQAIAGAQVVGGTDLLMRP